MTVVSLFIRVVSKLHRYIEKVNKMTETQKIDLNNKNAVSNLPCFIKYIANSKLYRSLELKIDSSFGWHDYVFKNRCNSFIIIYDGNGELSKTQFNSSMFTNKSSQMLVFKTANLINSYKILGLKNSEKSLLGIN